MGTWLCSRRCITAWRTECGAPHLYEVLYDLEPGAPFDRPDTPALQGERIPARMGDGFTSATSFGEHPAPRRPHFLAISSCPPEG